MSWFVKKKQSISYAYGKVAIIDDGINNEIVSITTSHIYVDSSHCDSIIPCNSHGTICAKIIESYGGVDEFVDIVTLNSNSEGTISDLINALEICKHIDVYIINISNGIELYSVISEEYNMFYDLCEQLSKSGKHIFAAQSNVGYITIAAAFPLVNSVEHINIVKSILTCSFRKSNYYTDGRLRIILSGKKYYTDLCNSYACAYASAIKSKGNTIVASKDSFISTFISIVRIIFRFGLKLTTPIVYCVCEELEFEHGCRLLLRLNNRFIDNGYRTVIASYFKHNDKYLIHHINHHSKNSYISMLCKLSNADIAIVLVGTKMKIKTYDGYVVQIKEGTFIVIVMENECSEYDLYNMIVNHYE